MKPPSCSGCPLEHAYKGFIPADGPPEADILVIGEAAGADEDREGKPYVGAAGYKLNSLLKKRGIAREHVRVHNCLSCRPPNNKLSGQRYEDAAIWKCQQYLNATLREPHKVVLATGAIPTRVLMKQSKRGFKLNDWHGAPTWVDGKWVVGTYHPSHLIQGGQKLTGVVLFDIERAKQLAEGTFKEEPAQLVVDPPLQQLKAWVDVYLTAVQQDPSLLLAVDTETIEKMKGTSEDALKGEVPEIVRINFSWLRDEGITFPWVGEYIEQAKRLLLTAHIKIMHNSRYDREVLQGAGIDVPEPIHDTMGMFKVLQSDLPRGLGFIAPFYSRYINPKTKSAAWKHLSGVDPGEYAAIDAFQTLRIAYGVKRDLEQAGQWDLAYYRHNYELRTRVLEPAEQVGLYINKQKLESFGEKLQAKEEALLKRLQEHVGDGARPWIGGLKKPKKGEEALWTEREVELEVYCCTGECKAVDVGPSHKCRAIKPPKPPKAPKLPKMRKPRKSRKKINEDISDDSGIAAQLPVGSGAASADPGGEAQG